MASSPSTSISHYLPLLLFCVFLSNWCLTSCLAHRTLGFDLHHRFSDKVKGILPVDGLPLQGTVDYYVAMAHHDRFLHGRRLASTEEQPPLTFSAGNSTFLLSSLGFLHYAFVSVGTPPRQYLVALDTGSDLFWLPCECTQCVTSWNTTNGQIKFNIYNTSLSSTSQDVPCSSSLCDHANRCSLPTDTCPYQVNYVSSNTSSTGYLVEDVLHLITDNEEQKAVNATITLGCGEVQTGIFLNGAAPNGLFGLGIEDIAVPTILWKQGLASNSFSMCFGSGVGRIEFGDNGTVSQKETPIDAVGRHPSYTISINQISVGKNVTDINFTAIFDTGTSFTYLTDPSYSVITQTFNALIEEKRYPTTSDFPFEYCYEFNRSAASFSYPEVNLTLKGGEQFSIMSDLLMAVRLTDKAGQTIQTLLCLGVVKSEDISLIGQNFMTGYRLVFDREKMVLGWREADCYSSLKIDTPAGAPSVTPSDPPTPSSDAPAVSPATAVNPSNTSSGNNTAAPAPNNHAAKANPINYALLVLLFLGLTIV